MTVIGMTSFSVPDGDAGDGPAALSISEVSRRTGIPVAGLRNWEQRYGLPRPRRSAGGQRRYTEADCDLLAEVLRRHAGGLSLPAAIGSFQRQRFYRAAAPRWADLARSAEQTVIFADFGRSRLRPGPVAEIPVPWDSPLRREWSLVCDAPDLPACVTGWEHPGQDGCRDADRIFEVLWSVDPQVVRTAARIGTARATAAFPAMTRPLRPG